MLDLHRALTYLTPGFLPVHRQVGHDSPGDALGILRFLTLASGAIALGLPVCFWVGLDTPRTLWRWWRSLPRKYAARLAPLAPVPLDQLTPGVLGAVIGRVAGGGGPDPEHPTGHLILEDAYGVHQLRVGTDSITAGFCRGDTVFAVGVLERRSGNADYRSGVTGDVLVPTADGFFLVTTENREQAIASFADRSRRPPVPLAPLAVLGIALLFVGFWLLSVQSLR